MRKKVIAGNWKMNHNPEEAKKYLAEFIPMVKDATSEVVLCVPYLDLKCMVKHAKGSNVHIGAQNMHWEEKGAYTGEISGSMLQSIGVEYVIIGHSERRQYFAETDDTVNKKIKAAFANNLKPIVCVGETLEQREQGVTDAHIAKQISEALKGLSAEEVAKSVIAYEPIWAIGTGKTCDSTEANRVIKHIRSVVEKEAGKEAADAIRILYGGSVKPETIAEQMAQSDIDGALVGGASLKADSFADIVKGAMAK